MQNFVRVLKLIFSTPVSPKEVPCFRGAVIQQTGVDADILFHNHDGNSFRYSYPLIQYKSIGGKGAIIAIDEGADIIGQFISKISGSIDIGGRIEPISVEKVIPSRFLMQTWERMFNYRVNHWLPLNPENYRAYMATDYAEQRFVLLEKILIGNLLSMLKGLGIFLEKELKVHIEGHENPFLVKYKDIKLMAFNLDFSSNLFIPDNMGIGKNSSIGYGNVRQIRNFPYQEQ